jgi:hypothetical protein
LKEEQFIKSHIFFPSEWLFVELILLPQGTLTHLSQQLIQLNHFLFSHFHLFRYQSVLVDVDIEKLLEILKDRVFNGTLDTLQVALNETPYVQLREKWVQEQLNIGEGGRASNGLLEMRELK